MLVPTLIAGALVLAAPVPEPSVGPDAPSVLSSGSARVTALSIGPAPVQALSLGSAPVHGPRFGSGPDRAPFRLCADGRVLEPAPAAEPAPVHGPEAGDDELRALYEQGRSYRDFLSAATRRVELWQDNTARAEGIDPSLVARARAVGGAWRFLAVAVDSCSDSVNTIPYLAELVARVDGLDMRVVDSTVGRSIMESHRTPDGRPSTPTVLLLNEAWDEAGCFIERPPKLQTWLLDEAFEDDQVYPRKMAWYADDGGQNTVEAFVEMLEAAERGETICR